MTEIEMSLTPKKVDVSVEYCVPCDYSEQALRVIEELVKNYQHVIGELTVRMGSNGVFKVTAGDEVLFSKKEAKRYPRSGEVLDSFKALVGSEVSTYPRT